MKIDSERVGMVVLIAAVILGLLFAYSTRPSTASAADNPPAITSEAVKRYQATITTKDGKNNTKTFTDYCEAKSNSEATTIFKQRYPNGTVSGVRES